MEIRRKQDLIKNIAKRWREQYPIGCDPDHEKTYKILIDKKPKTEKEIEEIIGNVSWTRNECDECGKDSDILIGIGWDSEWHCVDTYICSECLNKAILKIEKEK